MLQGLEAADHGLDAGTHLLITLQQRGALAGEAILPLTQRPVLFAQCAERVEKLVDLLFEATDFGVEGDFVAGLVAHVENYRRQNDPINAQVGYLA